MNETCMARCMSNVSVVRFTIDKTETMNGADAIREWNYNYCYLFTRFVFVAGCMTEWQMAELRLVLQPNKKPFGTMYTNYLVYINYSAWDIHTLHTDVMSKAKYQSWNVVNHRVQFNKNQRQENGFVRLEKKQISFRSTRSYTSIIYRSCVLHWINDKTPPP